MYTIVTECIVVSHVHMCFCLHCALCARVLLRDSQESVLLIQTWRLSDPAPNPRAHQISHRWAFVPMSPAQGRDHSFPLM